MNQEQIQAMAGLLRFVTSKDFTSPYNVKNLNKYCTAQIQKLKDAKVDEAMIREVQNIFNAKIYKYL